MKYSYIFLSLSLTITKISMAMQQQAHLTQAPDFLMCSILKYLSTEQILKFREVNKRAQQVAECFLHSNYSKKITISHTSFPALALVNKFSGITLRVTTHPADVLFSKLINNVAHIKALKLDLLYWPCVYEQVSIKDILAQIQQLEVLKIVQHSYEGVSFSYHFLLELLQALPAYACLKKLYINSQALKQWDTLLNVLPTLKTLEVLKIKGSRPCTTEQFIAFTHILQTLQSLKKLCIHAPLNEQEVDALTKSRSILKNLRVLKFIQQSFHKTDDTEYLPYLISSLEWERIR